MITTNYYFYLCSPVPGALLWNEKFSTFINRNLSVITAKELSFDNDKIIFSMADLDELLDLKDTPELKIFAVKVNPYKRMVLFYLNDKSKENYSDCFDFKDYVKKHISQKNTYDARNTLNLVELFTNGIRPDYIIEFDNIEADFKQIPELNSVDIIPGLDHLKGMCDDYRSFYDQETLEIVTEIFKKDIEYFGYKF